jgi:hypothetical protein
MVTRGPSSQCVQAVPRLTENAVLNVKRRVHTVTASLTRPTNQTHTRR